MTEAFGRWPEGKWHQIGALPGGKNDIRVGVDVGTTSTQATVVRSGQLWSWANIHTGANFAAAAEQAVQKAIEPLGLPRKDIDTVCATGWGKQNVVFADKALDEVHCHARGARYLFGPEVHTVVDMGGQSVKAIRLYDWDRVRDFMIGDKCATGFGRGVELACQLLRVSIEEIGPLSLEIDKDPEPVSSTCKAFAQTEMMGLFRPDFKANALSEGEVYASYLFALTWRVLGLVGRLGSQDVGKMLIDPGLGFTGGLAKNPGITKRLERELGVIALTPCCDPQLAGAIGAALLV